MDKTNKIEDTVLVISKYECRICDKIYRDELSLKHHSEEYHRDDLKEEPVQNVASTEDEYEVKFYEYEQSKSENIERQQSRTEVSAFSHQEKQNEPCAAETIKIKKTELNYGDAEIECNICDIIFTDQFSLEHHVNECHQDDREEKLKQHSRSTEQRDDVKLKCDHPNCGKSFKTKAELNRHLVIHKDKRPYKCQETGCTKSFKRKDKLKDHMKAVHNEERSFKCEETSCTKSFKRKDNLIEHMRVHSDARPFKCKFKGCTMTFKWKPQLNQHIVVHSGDRPFKCQHIRCKWSFKRKGELKYHLRSHSDETPFSCQQPGCTKSYKSKRILTKHMAIEHSHKIFIKLEEEISAVEGETVLDINDALNSSDGLIDVESNFLNKE